MIDKEKIFYKDSGKGKNALIIIFYGRLDLNKNTIINYSTLAYWKYLKEFCKYDNVYILQNSFNDNKEKIKIDTLDECKDYILFNSYENEVLSKLNINDVIVSSLHMGNFFGGRIQPSTICLINRLYEWYKTKTESDNLFIIQDDPELYNTNPVNIIIDRLFFSKTLKIKYYKSLEKTNKIIDDNVSLLEENKLNVNNIFNEVKVGFVGNDYNIFYDKIKAKNKTANVTSWDNFEIHIWNGVNLYLDEKFTDYDYNEKKYDCIYVGGPKHKNRVTSTENYYKELKNKFLHVYTRKPFFINLLDDVHYDSLKGVHYPEIYKVVGKNAKATFVSHNIETIGNQWSPRFFDAMLGDIICFLDKDFDKNYELVQNEELRKFMYVDTPKQFIENIEKISNDETYYKHIKYLQRLEVFNKFKSYINEENIYKYKEKLNSYE